VYAECIDLKRDLLVFDIEIKNESRRTLFVDPEEIYYYSSHDPFPDYTETTWENDFQSHPVYAKSPRAVQDHYEKMIRSDKNTKTILAIIGAAFVVYDAVQDGHDFRFEPTRKRLNKSIVRDIGVAATLTAIDIAGDVLTEKQIKSDEDLYYLTDEILKSRPIEDGRSIRGKVYLHQNYKRNYYRLLVQVEDLYFVFDFRWSTGEEKKVDIKIIGH